MRVLLVHNFYQQAGGEDVVFRAEHTLLEQAGHTVDSFTLGNAQVNSTLARTRSALEVTWSWRSHAAVLAKLRRFTPDIVHVHNFFPLVTPAVFDACRKIGVPTVMTLHNYRLICAAATLLRGGEVCETCITRSAYWGTWHKCYRGSLVGSLAVAGMISAHRRAGTWRDKVDRFIVLTEFQKRKLVEAGLPDSKLVVKPNFLPASSHEQTTLVRHRHGALFVGRLSPEKGIDTLLEAWRGISYPLTIIGSGPSEARLREGAPPHVTFLGHQGREGVVDAMQRAAFLVMPSVWYEGFPMTLIEAYAEDLPVVASRVGALAELVEDEVTGFTFAAGEPRDLRRAAREAIERPIPKGNCRRRYLDRYTAAVNLPQLERIYATITMCGIELPRDHHGH